MQINANIPTRPAGGHVPPSRGPARKSQTAPLFVVLGLVMITLAIVGFVRLTGIGAPQSTVAPEVSRIDLYFQDRADGSIGIVEAGSGRLVESVAPGTNGFLRGTMRGLARERRRQGIGPEQPFSLVGRADGRLTLDDATTGRRVDLGSFGPMNAAVFLKLLPTAVTPAYDLSPRAAASRQATDQTPPSGVLR